MKALLSKHKENGSIISDPVYFNSATKRVINSDKYMPDISFQVILYRINNQINEGSGWVIKFVDAEYMNISIYSPL